MKEQIEIIQDTLLLINLKVTKKAIKSWTQKQKDEVIKYCSSVHFRASDNHVKVCKKPSVLNGYKEIRN